MAAVASLCSDVSLDHAEQPNHGRSAVLATRNGGFGLKTMSTSAKSEALARGELRPIGVIRSALKTRKEAPKQGSEGAPDGWLEVYPWAVEGLDGLVVGDKIIVLTWFHLGRRDVLKVHPRGDRRNPPTGVFATRSPDRPNPLGLHPVIIRAIEGSRLRLGPIEAIDGTPVVDLKPVL